MITPYTGSIKGKAICKYWSLFDIFGDHEPPEFGGVFCSNLAFFGEK